MQTLVLATKRSTISNEQSILRKPKLTVNDCRWATSTWETVHTTIKLPPRTSTRQWKVTILVSNTEPRLLTKTIKQTLDTRRKTFQKKTNLLSWEKFQLNLMLSPKLSWKSKLPWRKTQLTLVMHILTTSASKPVNLLVKARTFLMEGTKEHRRGNLVIPISHLAPIPIKHSLTTNKTLMELFSRSRHGTKMDKRLSSRWQSIRYQSRLLIERVLSDSRTKFTRIYFAKVATWTSHSTQ